MDLPVLPLTVNFSLIGTDAELVECCLRWQHCEALALDTEFMRVSTYYPKVGLIQVADGLQITLIDPLQITQWQPFSDLMTAPQLVKIFHSCSEDLLVFFAFLKIMPAPVFDTQISSAILNEGKSLSYQNLVKQRFNVDLPKAETRSDWLQRPLTAEQLDYAALDVAYLHQTWRAQVQLLIALGRENWVLEDCARISQQYSCEFTKDFSDYYLNFKAAWQLKPRQLLALQKLAEWREQRARLRDKPRSWIIKDTVLLALANAMISSKSQLAALEDVSDNFIRFEGDMVLALIEAASTAAETTCPQELDKPLTQGQKNRLKLAQQLIETKAQELAIPAEVLGRKRTLQALLYALLPKNSVDMTSTLDLPDELLGWRGPFLLESLTQVLQP